MAGPSALAVHLYGDFFESVNFADPAAVCVVATRPLADDADSGMTAALIPSANTPMLKPLPIFFTGFVFPYFRSEHLTILLEMEHVGTEFLQWFRNAKFGVGTSIRYAGRRLNVRFRDREVRHEREECHAKDDGGRCVSEVESAEVASLTEVIGERSTERPSDDVGEPEGGDAVQAESPPGYGGKKEDDREENSRPQVAQAERCSGEVAQRRAQSERGEDRGPIEGFASLRRDAVNGERPFAAVPKRKDGSEDDGPQHCRPGVRDVYVEVEEVCDAGAEGGDRVRQKPVRERSIAASSELPHESNGKHRDLDSAAFDVAEVLQVVGGCLTAGGSENLHHPEEQDDLRNLGDEGRRKNSTDDGKLAVR